MILRWILHSLIIIIIKNNNNKCKDNKTNNGEDHNDQTYTQRLCENIQLRLRILLNEFKN